MSTEAEYRAAVTDLRAAERRLGQTPRSSVEARAAATRDVELATVRLRQAKGHMKCEYVRRNAAGLGSALQEAVVARFGPEIGRELEDDALKRFADREVRAAEWRQTRQAPPPPPKPAPAARAPGQPEVIRIIARQTAPSAHRAPET